MADNEMETPRKEDYVIWEKGNRILHYTLRNMARDLPIVVGIERGSRHFKYSVSAEFLRTFGSTSTANVEKYWTSKQEVFKWLEHLAASKDQIFPISNIEIHLASSDLTNTIVENSKSSPAQKAKALIFLRHHINLDLKNEYLTEKDPAILWKSLKDRFHQQSEIILPQAQYDWLNLRFQDFKTVTDYNSALHCIISRLKLCEHEVSENDLIQKTLSTFHASNLILEQQYRAKNYTTHSGLINALLVAEKHNQLLMRNHNARPVGSQAVPEAHANNWRGRGRGRGRGNGRGFGGGRNNVGINGRGYGNNGGGNGRGYGNNGGGNGRGYGNNNGGYGRGFGNNFGRGRGFDNNNRGRGSFTYVRDANQQNICYKCGANDHWSRTCRTPLHLVEAYQRMQRIDKGKTPKGESHHTSLPEASMNMENDDLLGVELEEYGDAQ